MPLISLSDHITNFPGDIAKSTDFPWTEKSERAAMWIADGSRTIDSICKELDLPPPTLKSWRSHPEFRDRVKSILDITQRAAVETGVLNKTQRVAALADLYQRMKQIIDERAVHSDYQEVPGGTTGLLVKTTKMVGGKTPLRVDEFLLDKDLVKEMSALLKQVAQEQGQWVEKQETDHTITKVEVVYQDSRPEDL